MGCSASKSLSATVVLAMGKRDPLTVPGNTPSCYQTKMRVLENCIIVWLVAQSSIRLESITDHLRRVVSTLRTFTDPDACVTYITHIREEKLFLIVPSEADQFVERVRQLSQIEKIYFFDASSQTTKTLRPNIFRDIDVLCERLHQDVELCELDRVAITALPAEAALFSASVKQKASFLCAQLLKEIMNPLKVDTDAKSVFVDFCRVHYAEDNEQLRAIDDFERNYRPQKALWWLTKSCFVSRIMQRAQRTNEIDIIYHIRFLIKHMHMQLTILHEKIPWLTQNTLIVYRAKTMSSEDFNTLVKNSRGGLLSFPHFIIASIDKNVAVQFIRRRIATHPEMTATLFEIHIDPKIRSTTSPFASLDNIDPEVKSRTGEICFSASTVFRIESVEEVADSSLIIWLVKLTLVDDNDQQLHRLIEPLRNSEVHVNPSLYMSKLLIEMGEYDRAEEFFLNILLDNSVFNQPDRLCRIKSSLGAILTHKGDHTKALEHYQAALEVSLSYLHPEHPDLAPIYNAIGGSYSNIGDYVQALHNYERAARLVEQSAQPPDQQFSDDLYSRIANTKQLLERNT